MASINRDIGPVTGAMATAHSTRVRRTLQSDLRRSMRVFGALPIEIRWKLFTIPRAATQSMLGMNGALAISGGPTRFDHADPFSGMQVTVQDPAGRFTQEVWNAVRDWTNLGGVRIFYISRECVSE